MATRRIWFSHGHVLVDRFLYTWGCRLLIKSGEQPGKISVLDGVALQQNWRYSPIYYYVAVEERT